MIDYLNTRQKLRLLRYEQMELNRLFVNQLIYEIEKFVEETFGVFSENNEKYDYLLYTLMTYMKLNRAATKQLRNWTFILIRSIND